MAALQLLTRTSSARPLRWTVRSTNIVCTARQFRSTRQLPKRNAASTAYHTDERPDCSDDTIQRAWIDAVTIKIKGARPPCGQRGAEGEEVGRELEFKAMMAITGTDLEGWLPEHVHPDLPYVDLLPPTCEAATILPDRLHTALATAKGIGRRYEIHAWDASAGFREDGAVPTHGAGGFTGLHPVQMWSSSSGSGSHLSASEDPYWAIDAMNLPRDGSIGGSGVVIAHPDSGYRSHAEFDAKRIDKRLQRDFLKRDSDPMVTTSESATHGRHGLGTGSAIISSRNSSGSYGDGVKGIAYQAEIVPMRVTAPGWLIPGPVLLSSRLLEKAIHHAADHGMDVISISLGMAWSTRGMKKAVRRARCKGAIVVAAGGNYTLGVPVYPAALPEVIGCAASNASGLPWRSSGYGGHINITAPGESVWRATVDEKGTPLVGRGTGTSYAVANIAGLAALWLERNGGREAIMARSGGDGYAVGRAFSEAMRQSAKSIGNGYGAGLVDGARVLA